MDNLNFDLDISPLSAVNLQRLGVTIAQVRAAFADPVATIEPDPASGFPDVWQLVGFTNTGRLIIVALEYDDRTRKLTALGVDVVLDLNELRHLLCTR